MQGRIKKPICRSFWVFSGVISVFFIFIFSGLVSAIEYPILDCGSYPGHEGEFIVLPEDWVQGDPIDEGLCVNPSNVTEEHAVKLKTSTSGNYPVPILAWTTQYDNFCFKRVDYDPETKVASVNTGNAGLIADRVKYYNMINEKLTIDTGVCVDKGKYATDGGKSYASSESLPILEIPGLPIDGFMYWGSVQTKIQEDGIESGSWDTISAISGNLAGYKSNTGFMQVVEGVPRVNTCNSVWVSGSDLNKINRCEVGDFTGYCAFEKSKEPTLADSDIWFQDITQGRKVRCVPDEMNKTIVRVESHMWSTTPLTREFYFSSPIQGSYLQSIYYGNGQNAGETKVRKFIDAAWRESSLSEPELNCHDPSLPDNPAERKDYDAFPFVANGVVAFPDVGGARKLSNGEGVCSNFVSKLNSDDLDEDAEAFVDECPIDGRECWAFDDNGTELEKKHGICAAQMCMTVPVIDSVEMTPDPMNTQAFRGTVRYSEVFNRPGICFFNGSIDLPEGAMIKYFVNITVVPTGEQYELDESGNKVIREQYSNYSEVVCQNKKTCMASIEGSNGKIRPSDKLFCEISAEPYIPEIPDLNLEALRSDKKRSNLVEMPYLNFWVEESYFHNVVDGQMFLIAEKPYIGEIKILWASNLITDLEEKEIDTLMRVIEYNWLATPATPLTVVYGIESGKKTNNLWPGNVNYTLSELKKDPLKKIDGTTAAEILKLIKKGKDMVTFEVVGATFTRGGLANVSFEINNNWSEREMFESNDADNFIKQPGNPSLLGLAPVLEQNGTFKVVGVIFSPTKNPGDFDAGRATLTKNYNYLRATFPISKTNTQLSMKNMFTPYWYDKGDFLYPDGSFTLTNNTVNLRYYPMTIRRTMLRFTEEIRRMSKSNLGVSVAPSEVLGGAHGINDRFAGDSVTIAGANIPPGTLAHETAHLFVNAPEEYPSGGVGGMPASSKSI